jgi:diaminopimelate decarboxylase
MYVDFELTDKIGKEYGDSFYLLDIKQFILNWNELINAFRSIYPETYIAYSYKTNYIPRLCKVVDELGGYAEVVSHMEYEIAKRLNVSPHKIHFNGPYKETKAVQELLLSGGIVNLDSTHEVPMITELSQNNPKMKLKIGIRCNFKINDGVISRFGFDITTQEFKEMLAYLKTYKNICIEGMHCHFASRSLETWKPRVEGMVKLVNDIYRVIPNHIDLGGGLFGKMKESLKEQFDSYIPSYTEYANEVATVISDSFKESIVKPKLFIEPGSALVGDVMKFVAKVISIKNIRGKSIATLSGSIYNINPTLNKKNPPITILHSEKNKACDYHDLDFAGYTCIESDYLYKGYEGKLSERDYVLFDNVGSYSVVLKPPFILPNFPVLELNDDIVTVIKRQETFDDLFGTYKFDF